MEKLNCWEAMGCGREPGGDRVKDLGICAVTTETRLDGVNGGMNGGRACWAVPRRNGVRVFGADEFSRCGECPFFERVREEEGSSFTLAEGTQPLGGKAGPVPWTQLRVRRPALREPRRS